MRVLVTGGAGFIGSHIVDRLVGSGHEVRVLDRLHPRAHAAAPDYLVPGVEYHWGDLADRDAVVRAVAGVDAVSHQGGMVGLGRDFGDVDAFVRDNDLGTATLLRALHDRCFDGHFVLASSMVVYGEGRYRCAEHGIVAPPPRTAAAIENGDFEHQCRRCGVALAPVEVPEDAAPDPQSVYAATKLHQEHLAQAFGRAHGIPITMLRYHNVYGSRMPRDTPYAGVASIFRSSLESGRTPRVLEDGAQLRDFVHVDDVVRANVLALAVGFDGPVNVASGRPISVLDVATALCDGWGGGRTPQVVGGARQGDVRHVFAATDRARDALGFVAEVRPQIGLGAFAAADLRRAAPISA
jgi:dTDP-L-rhamnose 4-epimerase